MKTNASPEHLKALKELPDTDTMPFMFVGHGSPMNAITDNEFSRNWAAMGQRVPRPNAVLCVSAHWLTPGSTQVTAMDMPRTIHDFGGFPRKLFEVQYPAPGAPDYARKTIELIRKAEVVADYEWGLDHGTWSVLVKMFPDAGVPVYQLSIDYAREPRYHYELARELSALRNKGVLVVGSGNVVHNLMALKMDGTRYDWAVEFDETMKALIDGGDDRGVVDFLGMGTVARLAHPTHDHFLPLIYALGLRTDRDRVEHFNDDIVAGSISMRSIIARPE
ncbi:MAG: 4,5-DOPA dioxygenase extradiol [SAR202 cluster bacterium]|nr:4,5-DOPA dioxygenase extradiol [SAR202 cluster bacterium]